MKKILAILALAASGSVFAASATLEGQSINGLNGSADQVNLNLTVRESINKNFTGDVQFSQTNNKVDGGKDTLSSTRLEAALTGSAGLFGPVSGYTRVAVGQKFSSSTNFGYYSVEPGLSTPLGGGLTAKVGYRYRTAFDSSNNDTTRTMRAGVAYDINKTNQIGVRYDSVRGDAKQNVIAVNYTRSF